MSRRPNFLLLMTDQQRGDCLGIEGHPVLMTPNMDSIAGAGVRFSRCYATCPTCIAARRSLLSGQFPPTHGMVGYRDGVEWGAPPTLGNATIAEVKRRLGRNIAIMPVFVEIFQSMADRGQVRRSVERMFRQAAPGDNFIPILVADPCKTVDETRFLLDEARKHQTPLR